MGQKLWISTSVDKPNHCSVAKAKELLLNEQAVSSILIDKTISEAETDAFLAWMIKAMRTAQVRPEHDFRLISDYTHTKHIQARCESINSSVWKKPNKRFTLEQLPPEYKRICLDVYRRKGMGIYSIHEIINRRLHAKLLSGAIGILVKNDIMTPVAIVESEYSEHIPNKYTFTPNGAEEIIALKGQLARSSLAVAEPKPTKTKAKTPTKPTVGKRVVEYINSIF